MRPSHATFVITALAACSSPAATPLDAARDAATDAATDAPPDGPTADWSCVGAPAPTTAPAQLALGGVVLERRLVDLVPRGGVVNDVFAAGDETTVLATTTSATGSGAFTTTITTGGAPRDVYLRHRGTDLIDAYSYLPRPLATDLTNAVIVTLSSAQFSLFEALAGRTQDPTRGFLVAIVLDCQLRVVPGAQVTTSPPATATIYAAADSTPSDASATTDAGIAYLFDLPIGAVVVNVQVGAVTYPARTIAVRRFDAPAFTAVYLAP